MARPIDTLRSLADSHGGSMSFSRNVDPAVNPVEATIIEVLAKMSEKTVAADRPAIGTVTGQAPGEAD